MVDHDLRFSPAGNCRGGLVGDDNCQAVPAMVGAGAAINHAVGRGQRRVDRV